MFTLTKKTEYALLALSFLALEGQNRLVGPREIAQRHCIPAELLAKVMQTLARHRLAASVPGPTGGYRLARLPQDISVADIVQAVDGPLAIAPCYDLSGVDGCAQSCHCTIRDPLARIQDGVIALLRDMTLADLCRAAPDETARLTRGLSLHMLGTELNASPGTSPN